MALTKECIFNVPVFSWESWDESDLDELVFYGTIFEFDSMKQYNGKDVSLNRNGLLTIFDDTGEKIFSNLVINIPEYRDILMSLTGPTVIDTVSG